MKKPLSPCSKSGCRVLSRSKYCGRHQDEALEQQKAREQRRTAKTGNANQRGYTYKWAKASKRFLADNPLCRRHSNQGLVVQATVVDHVTPHKGDMKLFWDEANWQPLCKPCHDRKTATEDGGFGR